MTMCLRVIGWTAVGLAAALVMVDASHAQPGGGGFGGSGGRGGPGGRGMMQLLPVMKALDADQDGRISAREIENATAALKSLDKNEDGELTSDELAPNFGGVEGFRPGGFGGPGPRGRTDRIWAYLVEKYDANADGRIAEDEYDRGAETFARLDRNKDGVLTPDDWEGVQGSFGSGEGQRSGDRFKREAPEVGERAPDFELSYVKRPDQKVRLSSFVGKKPVALIFGSCT